MHAKVGCCAYDAGMVAYEFALVLSSLKEEFSDTTKGGCEREVPSGA